MAQRKHWSGSALSELTTTSNTVWSDMATVTIPASEQTASKDMFVFWNGAFAISSQNTSDVQFRVLVDGAQKTLANLEPFRLTPTDYTHTGGFFKITAATTPANIVLKIQFKSETSGQTTRAKNTRIAVIEAATGDVYAESLTRVTKATTGFVDGVSATFTPATSGNYVALLCGYVDTSVTFNGAADVRLSDGTNTTATLGLIPYDPANLVPFVIGWRRTALAASSQTIKAQYQPENTTFTMGLSEQRLLILREDAFDAVYAATLASDDGNTTATYTDTPLSLTQTTSGNDLLQLSAWFQEGTSSSLSNYTQLLLDGATVAEMVHTTIDNSNDQSGHGVFMGQISAPGAGSHTWKVQRKSETTSTFTTVKRNATIFVFDLGAAAAGGDQAVTPSGIANANALGAPRLDLSLAPSGVATAAALGSPRLNLNIVAAGVASAAAAGSPRLDLNVAPAGLLNASALGAPSVYLAQAIAPSGIASPAALGSPALGLEIRPAGISSAATIGAPAVLSIVTLAPAGVANISALGVPALAYAVTAIGVASTVSLGAPALTTSVVVQPAGLANVNAVGVPVVNAGLVLAPSGVASTSAVGAPRLDLFVSLAGIAATATFGTARLDLRVGAIGAASTATVGVPSLVADAAVRPSGIASTIGLGAPRLDLSLAFLGLGNSSAFGVPVVAHESAPPAWSYVPLSGVLQTRQALQGAYRSRVNLTGGVNARTSLSGKVD